jgi:hypothetical protein
MAMIIKKCLAKLNGEKENDLKKLVFSHDILYPNTHLKK